MTTPGLKVSVVMQRKTIGQGRWSVDSWDAVGVLPHGPDQPRERRILRDEQDLSQILWPALSISLYPDRAGSYRYNLAGAAPAVYVLCQEDVDGTVIPTNVTVDPDEASAGIEGDDRVYALPMPALLYQEVEAFVASHPVTEGRPRRKHRPPAGADKP